ncbi:PINc/VapC family ATPase [Halomarina salina]|uniref:PINc/VapC family ATPase n=1 Tax=Halomarina salina TaxID=1872699 RepID=A0ABD5RKP0_9EURY|nr:PINc/VapC family ATPase [Halomarina salina]
MNVVPDTSVVVDGRVSERVESGAFADATVYVPEAVVGELEAQANSDRDIGWQGLQELQRLADLADDGRIDVEFVGRRANTEEIERARAGAIDALIRDVAADYDATFVTSDIVQGEVAKAQGLDVEYLEPYDEEIGELALESYFDDETMSVHLKTGVRPMAKRGDVGAVRYEPIAEEALDEETMRDYVHDVRNAADADDEGFTELSEPGMTIVQFRNYRIAIAEPPFSDGVEITAVRPVVKTTMADYDYSEEIEERLLDRQRGVLIAGAPGAGKSTYAQAVAGFLSEADYSVKTMEKPRDLQVDAGITQYTELDGDMDKTADALLMVRPDYTVYDEVRKTDDFRTFADMRLAGVGMVGVVHATRAIDALQRLIGRVELGMIPQVVDTVAYIEAGDVETIYDVATEVKVPHGLMEEDLARPVIVVSDHETQRPAYEIYTFNRQVVTVPLDDADGEDETGVDRLARNEIEREVRSVARGHVQVELQSQNRAVVYVEEDDISYVIGKGGGRIDQIEDSLGIDIDVRTLDERPDHHRSTGGAGGAGGSGGNDSRVSEGPGHAGEVVTPEITSRHIIVPVEGRGGETVEVRADGEYLFTATVSRGGEIQVSRGSAIAEEMEQAIDRGQQVTVVPS